MGAFIKKFGGVCFLNHYNNKRTSVDIVTKTKARTRFIKNNRDNPSDGALPMFHHSTRSKTTTDNTRGKADNSISAKIDDKTRDNTNDNTRDNKNDKSSTKKEEEEYVYYIDPGTCFAGGEFWSKTYQGTSVEICFKCSTTKNIIFYDKSKSTCKQRLSEKIGCKFRPSPISRDNFTTNIKTMHGASYNCEQCKMFYKI